MQKLLGDQSEICIAKNSIRRGTREAHVTALLELLSNQLKPLYKPVHTNVKEKITVRIIG